MSIRDIITETTLSRVAQHFQHRSVGIITAHRGEYDEETKRRRNAQLAGDLRKSGLSYTRVTGGYKERTPEGKERWVNEHSFVVHGPHKDYDPHGHMSNHVKNTLIRLGKKYYQDSILFKPHNSENASFHGTRPDGWLGVGGTHDVGRFHPDKITQYHTTLRGRGGKRSFVFQHPEVKPESKIKNTKREGN